MTDSTPTLYILNRNYSSWSLRAWMAMRTLGIKFNVIPLMVGTKDVPDLRTPACNALMAQAGPSAKVPALHIKKPSGERHVVFESLAILEFLAEEYPSLWPADKFDRAYARSLASEMATGFQPLRGYYMMVREKFPYDPALSSPAAEKDFLRITSIWQELRSMTVQNKSGDDQGYLFGHFTALDSMYSPIMYRLNTYGLVDKIPGDLAKAYVLHMLSTPAMQEWTRDAVAETKVIPSCEMFPKNKS